MATRKGCTGTNNAWNGKKLYARLITPTNPGGGLDINDLEIARKLLAWLVLEGIVGTKNLRYKHVGLFSDNMAAVSWKLYFW